MIMCVSKFNGTNDGFVPKVYKKQTNASTGKPKGAGRVRDGELSYVHVKSRKGRNENETKEPVLRTHPTMTPAWKIAFSVFASSPIYYCTNNERHFFEHQVTASYY